MLTIYLGLGSNLGDQHAYLKESIKRLRNCGTVKVISSFYKTEPVGYTDQAWFLNCVVKMITSLAAQELLEKIHEIEQYLGRIRTTRWGPRTIDIDILLYDNLVLETERLIIPHPRLHERQFVLAPLDEIAPEIIHPIFKQPIRELLLKTNDTSKIEKITGYI